MLGKAQKITGMDFMSTLEIKKEVKEKKSL